MINVNCSFCKKNIDSKKDLVLGTHYANNVTPYHNQCFDKAKKKLSFFSRPAMKIQPKKFDLFIAINILNIVMGFLMLFFADKISSATIYPFPLIIIFGLYVLLIGLVFTTTLLKYKKLT